MGHGLAGMRERFELLGGNLAISSAAGKGFVLRGTLPAAESTT
jgi:signal transduction histidine kinase